MSSIAQRTAKARAFLNKKGFKTKKKFTKSRQSASRQVIPNRVYKKLRYVDTVILTPGVADTPVYHTFSCNGLYDPNITGIGHQPMGFDVLMPLYDHYVGTKAELTLTITSNDATTTGQSIVGVTIKDSPTVSYSGNSHAQEQQRTIIRHLDVMGSGKETQVIKMKVNPNTFLSRKSPLSDPELKGTVSANPTEQCYFIVWVSGVNTGQIPSSVILEAQIDYTACFLEPKLLAQS